MNEFRYMTEKHWAAILGGVNRTRNRKGELSEPARLGLRWQIEGVLHEYAAGKLSQDKSVDPGKRRKVFELLLQDLDALLRDPLAISELNEAVFAMQTWDGHPRPRGPASPLLRGVCRSDDAAVSAKLWSGWSTPLGADQRPTAWGHAMARCLQDALGWLAEKEVPRNPEPDAAVILLFMWLATIFKTQTGRNPAATGSGPFYKFVKLVAAACSELKGQVTEFRLKQAVAMWKKSTALPVQEAAAQAPAQ